MNKLEKQETYRQKKTEHKCSVFLFLELITQQQLLLLGDQQAQCMPLELYHQHGNHT